MLFYKEKFSDQNVSLNSYITSLLIDLLDAGKVTVLEKNIFAVKIEPGLGNSKGSEGLKTAKVSPFII